MHETLQIKSLDNLELDDGKEKEEHPEIFEASMTYSREKEECFMRSAGFESQEDFMKAILGSSDETAEADNDQSSTEENNASAASKERDGMEKVVEYLNEIGWEYHADGGTVVVQNGSAVIFINELELPSGDKVIDVRSPVLREVRPTLELYQTLSNLNFKIPLELLS